MSTGGTDYCTNGVLPEVEGEDPPILDLCSDKDACVLELDEAEDVSTIYFIDFINANISVASCTCSPTYCDDNKTHVVIVLFTFED